MVGIEGEHATGILRQSWLVIKISDALVDLGVFPIWDIHGLPKLAQEVLALAGLIVECLREEHASNAGP
jgi:hypothetical protein